MRLIYHPAAEAELITSAQYYEQRAPGLGARFLDHLEEAIQALLRNPGRWPIKRHGIRRALLSEFPFGIYYEIHGDTVRVLAIAHHSRRPDYWRSRTAD